VRLGETADEPGVTDSVKVVIEKSNLSITTTRDYLSVNGW
jgi:hypothetical protein